MKKWHNSALRALFTLIAMVVVGIIAYGAHIPFLFPSLGPTTYLLFYKPESIDSSPKHAVLGHFVGAISGFIGLVAFGLVGATPDIAHNLSLAYVGSATIALVLTSVFMHWFKIDHPPAGATTLIISLGIINTAPEIGIMMLAVILLVAIGWACNNLIGIRYPVWNISAARRGKPS